MCDVHVAPSVRRCRRTAQRSGFQDRSTREPCAHASVRLFPPLRNATRVYQRVHQSSVSEAETRSRVPHECNDPWRVAQPRLEESAAHDPIGGYESPETGFIDAQGKTFHVEVRRPGVLESLHLRLERIRRVRRRGGRSPHGRIHGARDLVHLL